MTDLIDSVTTYDAEQLWAETAHEDSRFDADVAARDGSGDRKPVRSHRIASHRRDPITLGLRPWLAYLVFGVCFTLRYIRLQQAYDIYLDEITYGRISENVAIHHSVSFFGTPFYLHPPLVFLEQALFIDAFHIHGSAFAVVFALRMVGVLFAAGSAVLLLRLATRIGGSVAGIVAAVLFSVDPFLIRFDGRVFLEAPTVFWVLVGLTALYRACETPPNNRRGIRMAGVGAGLGFALAVLSNEIALPLFAVPLIVCLVLGRPFGRDRVITPVLTLLSAVAVYPIVAAATGHWHDLVSQQFHGFLRLVGAAQETGFNKAGAPSLWSRISANLHTFGAVYVLLILAGVVSIWLLRKGSAGEKFAVLVAGGAYLLIAYQIVFGTLEEQMFYYVDVPGILVVGLAVAKLVRQRAPAAVRRRRIRRGALLPAVVTVGLALLGFDCYAWVGVHTSHDQAMQSTIRWIDDNVPAGTRVAPFADTSQLLLNSYQVYVPATPGELRADQVAYALTSSLQVAQGYGFANQAMATWLSAHAVPVARYTGRTFGTMTIWRLPYPTSNHKPPGFPGINARLPAQPVGEG